MSHHTPTAVSATTLLEPVGEGFRLDRGGAMRTIARVWEIDPDDHERWWVGAFGDDLASSLEAVSRVVFSPRRGLVDGLGLEIVVLPVIPDSPAHPLMVGVLESDGPIVGRGIEDLTEILADPLGRGPDHVLDALEALLEIASELAAAVAWSPAPDWPRTYRIGTGRAEEQAVGL